MGANVSVVTVAALVVGLMGRVRPRLRSGDWAEDQARFSRHLDRGGVVGQAVVVLTHVLVRPRTSWRLMRTPAPGVRT